jgi:hypothetical protein
MRPADTPPVAPLRPAARDAALPWWRVGLALAVAGAAVFLLWQAQVDGRFVSLPGWRSGEKRQMWQLFGGSLAIALAAAGALPRHAHRALTVLLLVWIVVAFGPVAVAGVAAIAAAAATLGRRILRSVDPSSADLLTALSAGAIAISAVIGATAALRWHWPAAYAVALTGVFVVLRRDLTALLHELSDWWAPRAATVRVDGLLPWALLAAVVAVQVAVAARPEVGTDALAMHLEIAIEMARDHRFRFDVTRHVWAVMPLGADWIYAAAFQFGGEAAARLANLGALLLLLAWIVRLGAGGDRAKPPAVVAAALFASAPLAFAETGSLFIENWWTALLLAAASTGERAVRERSVGWALACLWLAAGAMQGKVLGLFWVAPLLLVVAIALRGRLPALERRHLAWAALALLVMAWPYLNAWWRTGNPVFPFMNARFRSPLFDTAASFNNDLYNSPLTWRSWYDITVHADRFLEGFGGAPGVHWLVLFPAVFLLLRASQVRAVLPLLALAAAFFVATWQQQSYLRYLYPAFALLLALAARIVLPTRLGRGAVAFGAALPLVAANLYLMPTGIWWNSTFCLRCGFDPEARARYVAAYAEQRPIVDWLNANAPGTRVGWLRAGYIGPAGLRSPHWRNSWHDYPTWRELRDVATPEALAEFARRRGTMLFLLPGNDDANSPLDQAIAGFRDRYTVPVFSSGGTLLARWADTPDQRLISLPADFDRVQRNAGVTRDGARIAFAPRGLAWREFRSDPPTLLTYEITGDCPVGGGKGVVEAAWLDGAGRSLTNDTRFVTCRNDGAAVAGSFFAPLGAQGLVLYVGSAGDKPFALSAFAASRR